MLIEMSETMYLLNLTLASKCILSATRLLRKETIQSEVLSIDFLICWLFQCLSGPKLAHYRPQSRVVEAPLSECQPMKRIHYVTPSLVQCVF